MLPPLRFRPLIKNLRWGGTRLGTVLNKPIGSAQDAAESWEIVDHGTDQSVVSEGPFEGWSLARIVQEKHTQLLGSASTQTSFPLLLKFLDAHDRLSLQVHPNDELAQQLAGMPRGKTEAWVILDAQPGSVIYSGLKAGIQERDLRAALASGTLEDCVHTFEARPGDCCFIPAGTVHAIGEGILLAEIQQTSDITYRLYDWGRLGADGSPRPLHVDHAIRCTDFTRGPVAPTLPQLVCQEKENRVEDLVACEYFQIRRHAGTGPTTLTTDAQFRLVMVLNGRITLDSEFGSMPAEVGQTLLIPACLPQFTIQPQPSATWLEITATPAC